MCAEQVYTRLGSYKGFELTQDGWELVHSASVLLPGNEMLDSGTFNEVVYIPAGMVQSFFVHSTDVMLYNVGTLEGRVFSSNDSLEFFEGAGVSGKFSGQVASPRVYSGQIR